MPPPSRFSLAISKYSPTTATALHQTSSKSPLGTTKGLGVTCRTGVRLRVEHPAGPIAAINAARMAVLGLGRMGMGLATLRDGDLPGLDDVRFGRVRVV